MLDIRNDSNQAMDATSYFGSQEDFGLPSEDFVPTDDIIAHEAKAGTNDHHKVPSPQPTFSQSQESRDVHEKPELNGGGRVTRPIEDPHPVQASRKDLIEYFFTDGNWTDLFATSANWMLLDFTFCLLGVNNTRFVPTLYGEDAQESPYRSLVENEQHIMESTSIGALIGSAAAILIIHYISSRKIQMWGFLILGVLFIVVGAMYVTLPTTNAHAAIVIFYGICQLFYNLGSCLLHPKTGHLLKAALYFRSEYNHIHCTPTSSVATVSSIGWLTVIKDSSRSFPH